MLLWRETAVYEPTCPSYSSTAVYDYGWTSGRSRPVRKYRSQRQVLPLLHLGAEIQHGRRRFWNPKIRPAHVQIMRHLSTLTGLCVWEQTQTKDTNKSYKMNKTLRDLKVQLLDNKSRPGAHKVTKWSQTQRWLFSNKRVPQRLYSSWTKANSIN